MSSNDKFLFFYGHHNGDEACLSNWYLAPFKDPELDNLEFSTNEKYMMYRKALLFKDKKSAKKILCSNDPKECKSLVAKLRNSMKKRGKNTALKSLETDVILNSVKTRN